MDSSNHKQIVNEVCENKVTIEDICYHQSGPNLVLKITSEPFSQSNSDDSSLKNEKVLVHLSNEDGDSQ